VYQQLEGASYRTIAAEIGFSHIAVRRPIREANSPPVVAQSVAFERALQSLERRFPGGIKKIQKKGYVKVTGSEVELLKY
jgi:hypothetical protein